MSDAAAAPDSDDAVLARMVARCDAAAERVHAKLMAAEETAEIAELVRAGQRLDRSIRQALLLKARLKRERDQAQQDAARHAERPRLEARKAELREHLTQAIRLETEPAEAPDFLQDLDFHLDLESHEEHFLDDPTPLLIARLRHWIGLEPTSSSPAGEGGGEADGGGFPSDGATANPPDPAEAPDPPVPWRDSG